ncbi:hypothetical protein [Rhodospirillum centenum]|uniref:Phage shock protein B n=1 Tax=Rhodospirillum centenum (strain ATCC 51521 / SW) TaxID=414684 RepID=B6IU22_RHOCS|nr:hypothetical protein [Rhodospirillum centenum]ACI99899.1 hypothetical protein RC1_2518 [Rhodospirillum centenum SW]
MTTGHLIAIVALLIPIVSIVTSHMRRWQKLEIKAAQREVELRRRFRVFDELERRVADMERHVTSKEYQLDREIGRLAGRP